MDYNIEDEKAKLLLEIGAIFESMGVNSVELAESIKEHIQNCPGGKACLEKLISKNNA